MGNDLLSGFNGTPSVRVETQTVPPGCGLKWRLWLQIGQEFVQQRDRRDFAVLFAIFPDHALSQGLYMTMHMHHTDFPAEWLDDFHTPGDERFAMASIHHGKDQSIEVRLRGCSEYRITDIPQQFGARGCASWKNGLNQVRSQVRMEDLQPCQAGNLFGDGQLADRRRSIQQNQFQNTSSYRMPLQPNQGISRAVYRVGLPKPGCRHPDSASQPCLKVSLHTAPQESGACHVDLRRSSAVCAS
jgi:hypothetical protein